MNKGVDITSGGGYTGRARISGVAEASEKRGQQQPAKATERASPLQSGVRLFLQKWPLRWFGDHISGR